MNPNDKQEIYKEPSLSDSRLGSKLENFWYHYKFHTIVAAIVIVFLIITCGQIATRDSYDFHVLYGGPQIMAVQDAVYIRKAFAEFGEDRNGDGTVEVSVNDVTLFSPEEQAAAEAEGAVFSPEYIRQTTNEFTQQIIAGDAVILLLSPYLYDMVNESGGFIPLAELFDEIPEAAHGECGLVLAKTDFGKSFNGVDDLPPDTVLCIRRPATTKPGAKAAEHHAFCVEVFKKIAAYTAPAAE